MNIYRGLQELPAGFGRSVVTVGNFDGVHRAHARVMRAIQQRAREIDAKSVVLTFEPHPTKILRPQEAPKLLTTMAQKLELIRQTGIENVIVIPFSRDLSMMPPFEFAEEILTTALHVVEVHEGFNFRFGHRAEGDVERLKEFGRKLGFDVVIYEPMTIRGKVVSSSQIRKLIEAGDMTNARHLLGRPFSIVSTPGRGRGYGTKYTVPTVNLARYDGQLPKNGVYVTCLTIGDEIFDAVTNVGNRPTFGPDSFAIESHILNFHPLELTQETSVELTFLKRLRDERKFPSVEALKEQIGYDIRIAQRYLSAIRRLT